MYIDCIHTYMVVYYIVYIVSIIILSILKGGWEGGGRGQPDLPENLTSTPKLCALKKKGGGPKMEK